jgi:hypothetical protein
MKTALYLDDEKTPTDTIPNYNPWVVVRNYDEFTNHITENGIPDLISFDHDLAEEHVNDYYDQLAYKGFQQPLYEQYTEKTGLDCANWLVIYCQNNKVNLKNCSVHSDNPIGSKNIQSLINGFKKHTDQHEDCYLGKHPFKI